MQENTSNSGRDPRLWEIARRRASFKSNLITYLIVNGFLWAIWYFTKEKYNHYGWPWPIWPTLGWGIGQLFHFFGAYVYPEANSAEREYEKLTKSSKEKKS
jgi:hypothetical protein